MEKKGAGKKYKSISVKHLRAMLVVSVITAIVLIPVISYVYRGQMEKEYSNKAFHEATIAAKLIDGDSIARYRETGQKDEYYEKVRQMLLTMKQTQGFDYFYVIIPYDDIQYYIWDAGVEGEEGICDLGDTEPYLGEGKAVGEAAFRVDAEQNILITNSKEYGYLASAYVAIMDSKGEPVALASVDISMDKINTQIRQFIILVLFIIIAVLFLCQFGYYVYMKKTLVSPLENLHEAVSGLVSENMERLNDFRIDIHTGDEIESIADAFDLMTKELDGYIKNLAAVTKEKERIGAELSLATKIQADMLPNIFPPFPDRKDIDIYASMTPAKEVGGDFYDFFLLDDDHLGLVIADVSGKGVPAALFMMMSKILVSNYATIEASPAAVLEAVNAQICKNNDEEMFVTVWLGILTISTGKVVAANAGHEYPILKAADGRFELLKDKHGFVVGGMEGVKYKDYEFTLERGGTLFVYTDGVAEATNLQNELFGTERMLEALNKEPEASPKQILDNMHSAVDSFVGEATQFDDLTMLAIKLL
ncbi:MAG: SpoIIE family protein phosphatase [Lachnospiraceae bacterium]|nr:SpoIIE family protein phosphatase [Lachnospiraceae bacterium]